MNIEPQKLREECDLCLEWFALLPDISDEKREATLDAARFLMSGKCYIQALEILCAALPPLLSPGDGTPIEHSVVDLAETDRFEVTGSERRYPRPASA